MSMRTIGRMALAAAAILLATCAMPAPPAPPPPGPPPPSEAQARILNGDVILRCKGACMNLDDFHRTAQTLYEARRWERLGLYIEREGISDSHSYYFLAVAAWKQGSSAAADQYMAMSMGEWKLGRRCTTCRTPADLPQAVSHLAALMRIAGEKKCYWDDDENWDKGGRCCWESFYSWRSCSKEKSPVQYQ